MTEEKTPPGKKHQVRDRLRRIEENVHRRVVAAEVAAEEAAGFGAGTAFVEAVEAAADPERLGGHEGQGVAAADAGVPTDRPQPEAPSPPVEATPPRD